MRRLALTAFIASSIYGLAASAFLVAELPSGALVQGYWLVLFASIMVSAACALASVHIHSQA